MPAHRHWWVASTMLAGQLITASAGRPLPGLLGPAVSAACTYWLEAALGTFGVQSAVPTLNVIFRPDAEEEDGPGARRQGCGRDPRITIMFCQHCTHYSSMPMSRHEGLRLVLYALHCQFIQVALFAVGDGQIMSQQERCSLERIYLPR